MPWIQKGFTKSSPYVISDTENEYHRVDEFTLKEMNEADSFRFCPNPNYCHIDVRSKSSLDVLPAGIYTVAGGDFDEVKCYPYELTKELDLFKFDLINEVYNDYINFLNSREIYRSLKLLYKRACLLYGPPGTGKTSSIHIILNSLDLNNVLVLFINKNLNIDLITELKNDRRLKIIIFEELTDIIKRSNTAQFLTFLDGENSLDNVYILATTNYPETLPGNLVNRPGRFDRLIQLDEISNKDRKIYLEHYLKRPVTDKELLDTTKFPIAFLKELVLLILKDRLSFEKALELINKHKLIADTKFKKLDTDSDLQDEIL